MWVTLGTKLAAYWAENSSKVIVMGVITVITLSILGYGYYKIDQGGYQRAKAECQEDENKIRADGDKLMKQRQQEHDLALKQNTDMYIGAIKQYAKTMMILSVSLMLISISACTSVPSAPRVIETKCPPVPKFPAEIMKEGRELAGQNWEAKILKPYGVQPTK